MPHWLIHLLVGVGVTIGSVVVVAWVLRALLGATARAARVTTQALASGGAALIYPNVSGVEEFAGLGQARAPWRRVVEAFATGGASLLIPTPPGRAEIATALPASPA